MIERVELDTSHFKGNAPGRILLEGVHAPGVAAGELTGWRPLLATAVEPHRRHIFEHELRRVGVVTHLRLSVFPCGGIARLRAVGGLAPVPARGLTVLNGMPPVAAAAAFLRCCGARRWADAMTAARPFEDIPALLRIAERTWWSLDEADHREAFGAHPKIGEQREPAPQGDAADPETTGKWARDEQRSTAVASEATIAELAEANRAYQAKHGFIFIVCATGRSAEAMLADCRERTARTPAEELRCAAEEQAKITRLRLAKLMGELA
jgi:allantoicase